jgi:hypothetical protein
MIMTSKERLIAAMKREDVDRIPLSPRLHHVTARYYKNDAVWAYKELKKRFDYDPTCISLYPCPNPIFNCWERLDHIRNTNLKIICEDKDDHFIINRTFSTPAGELHDRTISPKPGASHYGTMANPHKEEYLIKTKDDLEKLKYMMPDIRNANFSEFHYWTEEMGNDGLVLMNIYGPMDYTGSEAYSMQDMMLSYYADLELFDAILDFFAELSLNKTIHALENGVRNFFLCNFYASLSSGWSPEILEKKFLPVVRKQTEMIHADGGLVDYYDDGKLMQSINLLINAGVDVIETCSPPPVGDFRLAEAKKKWGDKVTFKGCADMINVIADGTPEQIDAHIKDIVEQNGGKRGLILGTMDGIRPETSDENIAAYFAAANKYR